MKKNVAPANLAVLQLAPHLVCAHLANPAWVRRKQRRHEAPFN
jgi:hypothetical protein